MVGDPDQAIYGWRGADISNILEFEDHYPGCRCITLGENFRSTARDPGGGGHAHPGQQAAEAQGPVHQPRRAASPSEAVLCRDERHEAQRVVEWMQAAKDEAGLSWKDMAVFYRTNSLSRVMEDAFRGAERPVHHRAGHGVL